MPYSKELHVSKYMDFNDELVNAKPSMKKSKSLESFEDIRFKQNNNAKKTMYEMICNSSKYTT